MFVVSLSSGELRLEKQPFEDTANSFSKIAKWILLDPSNISSRRAICVYDEVVLKSPFGKVFLHVCIK